MGVIILMAAIMFAWFLQTGLGSMQIKNFNKHYTEMRSQGKVSIGRSKGIFRSGVVLLMSIDKDKNIVDARKMQGVTILARFKSLSVLEGQNLLNIEKDAYLKLDKYTRKAFDEAVEIYQRVSRGEEIPPSRSPFGKLVAKFQ